MSNIIRISTDSASDLPKALTTELDISVIPFYVNIGTEQFRDGIDIDSQTLYEKIEAANELSKTAAISPAEFEDYFRELTKNGESLIHFNLSSGLSCTFQNAQLAAAEVENVFVIDSQNLSSGIALLILAAADMVREGKMSAAEIADAVNTLVPKVESSFVLDTLEFLHKGGRCSALAMFGANVLKLKPCIEVKDGKMGVGKKYRGKMRDCLLSYVRDRLEGRDDIDTKRIFVTDSGGVSDEIISEIVKEIGAQQKFEEMIFNKAGCAISTHCGSGTLGILFIRK